MKLKAEASHRHLHAHGCLVFCVAWAAPMAPEGELCAWGPVPETVHVPPGVPPMLLALARAVRVVHVWAVLVLMR